MNNSDRANIGNEDQGSDKVVINATNFDTLHFAQSALGIQLTSTNSWSSPNE